MPQRPVEHAYQDWKQSPFPPVVSLQHPVATKLNIMTTVRRENIKWPESIFTELTKIVNLDLRRIIDNCNSSSL